MDTVELRPYRPADLDALVQLDESCFPEPFRFSRTAMRRYVKVRNSHVVLAESGSTLAGFAILHIEYFGEECLGYIVTLDVSNAFRRRGIAHALIEAMERHAAQASCMDVALHVYTENEPAILFYEAEGYQRQRMVPGFYGTGRDAWIYAKSIRT